MIPVTFVDIETTGLNEQVHEIIEVGAVKTTIQDNLITIIAIEDWRILPVMPVDPTVANINGYDAEEWIESANLVDLPEAMEGIFALMKDSWHAGSKPRFDEKFLKKACDDMYWTYPKLASYHLLDVSTMAFPLLMKEKINRLSQESIGEFLKIPGGGHRALADAQQCLKIFAKLNNLEVVYT